MREILIQCRKRQRETRALLTRNGRHFCLQFLVVGLGRFALGDRDLQPPKTGVERKPASDAADGGENPQQRNGMTHSGPKAIATYTGAAPALKTLYLTFSKVSER